MEKYFPHCGKNGSFFPHNGKTFRRFSTQWKNFFHGVENPDIGLFSGVLGCSPGLLSGARGAPYRYSRVMDRRGGEPREAPRTRLFITLPNRCRFELRTVGGGNGMKVETRVGPATNKPPFQWMDGARFSSRDDAPAAETNTPEDGRVQASTIRLSQVAGSRVPVAKPYGRKIR